jgi:hypothetical protein
VRFRLTYDGPLPTKCGAIVKQEIREYLHPQMVQLWKFPPLDDLRQYLEPENDLSVLIPKGDHWFAALVCRKLHLVAELDILLLTPHSPNSPLTLRGDIDNRMKTLLDALAGPNAQQIKEGAMPSSVEEPVFVLLQDDLLVMRVNLETDRLLAPGSDDAKAIIYVTTRVESQIWGNLGLG